ncbi:MAG TPA: DNA primase [Pyrinomonadaceae bacterium]|nr:DNA primase [Chloracidobacterium sp.]MBP9934519.1 DNA primase [Pyrinomonadaceae bacterium]MBK9437349.1 DNA primase [Chloracidobacterium sp.]MBL0240023.1 DNA primase [Chloracidobacterium sp.]HQX54941.1 DNA primase [Pyrinomonadaceae bacterium]
MLYPQYFIDDLKNRADLVRIIQPYAQDLKKKGANWMACCPFHQEKTPSFSVNPSKGFYKCFGCGKGGTAYNFLMEMEGLNFPEAVKRVAEISGVMLPEPIDDANYERGRKQREEKKQLADQIIELNQIALDHWEKELQGKSKKAKEARAYLETRGISDEVQKQFRIGFAHDSWDDLLSVLRDYGADEKLIVQSGLVSVNEEKERTFDRFRGRIMFPVLDVNGRPVAFGARSLDPEDQPKYLNSPETPAYTKGEHLYGLFQAKDEIRKKKFAILVEGYLDLIALAQFGITNVAASLGTAFTPQQAKVIKRFTENIVITYDSDEAGAKAAKKIMSSLLFAGFELKVLQLPDKLDPDDFIRRDGAEKFNQLRGQAPSILDFLITRMPTEYNLSNNQQRIKFIEEVMPICASFRSTNKGRAAHRQFFDQLMLAMRVDDPGTRREWWNSMKEAVRTDARGNQPIEITGIRKAPRGKITIAERRLLELLVFDRDLRDAIIPQLEPSDYQDLATAELFDAFIAITRDKMDVSQETILEHIGDDETSVDLAHLLLKGEPRREKDEVMDAVLTEAENCVFTLRNMAIANRIVEISRDAVMAEQSGNSELFSQLTYEQLELEKIRRELQRQTTEL